jgi:hypothetical protein
MKKIIEDPREFLSGVVVTILSLFVVGMSWEIAPAASKEKVIDIIASAVSMW